MAKEVTNISLIWRKGIMLKKHIRRLKISGSIKPDPFNILSEQKRFYQDQYTSKNITTDSMQTAESFLSNLDIPRLTEEQKLSCEGKITPLLKRKGNVLPNIIHHNQTGYVKVVICRKSHFFCRSHFKHKKVACMRRKMLFTIFN